MKEKTMNPENYPDNWEWDEDDMISINENGEFDYDEYDSAAFLDGLEEVLASPCGRPEACNLEALQIVELEEDLDVAI